MRDLTIYLGHYGLAFALVSTIWATIASVLSASTSRPALQRSAERALIAAASLCTVAAFCLIAGYLANDFRLDVVYGYSNTSQALPYKIGALWGSQAGSLLLWVVILGVMGWVMVATNRHRNRALMPWATAVVAVIMAFFLYLLNFIEPPFAMSDAFRPDGVGLNPQLKNYWMMIHPPTLYMGYVAFTIPFAFGVAALITRRTGDLWFRTTRRWTLMAWFFLGTGVLLGSYWAYIELGWGGYWAWDPVENASLMPWLTGTAFLHSVMIQEKKGMLKVWNVLLVMLTFCLSIFGTFLTRSGIISSVHSFTTSGIGPAFGWFLILLFVGSLVLLIVRLPDLRSEGRLESVMSRESTFLFNNLVLVGIAVTVLLLTTFPMISEAVTGRKVTMGPPIFNLVNIPWALALLTLTGIGPLIAWRKTSRGNLSRNFRWPVIIGMLGLAFSVIVERAAFGRAAREIGGAIASADVYLVFDELKGFYPALTYAIGIFVVATVVQEYLRGLRVRRKRYDETPWTALRAMIMANQRRYGGYIVHVGMVLVFIGIAASSAHQQEIRRELEIGEALAIEDYLMRYDSLHLEVVDDHIGAVAEVTLFDRNDGTLIGSLHSSQRFHPNMQIPELREAFLTVRALGEAGSDRYQEGVHALYSLIAELEQRVRREVKTPSTEVGIYRTLSPLAGTRIAEDFYVIPLWVDPGSGRASFRVFVNPLVNFLWLGGLVFILGAIVTVLPDAREKKRLEAAMELEDRAVA
ncbi:MAG: heme lyase CcmF/NrfE family subunit [Acidobacteriota bacterium]|nr:heme lyase CcmF/NrfE family subunit [Acidobacteriota bacterium]